MELGVAVGLFVLVAGLITATITGSVSTEVNQRTQGALTTTLTDLVTAVEANPYSQLIENSWTPPSSCTSTDKGTAATSCVTVLGTRYTVHYSRQVGPDVAGQSTGSAAYISITATTTGPDGHTVSYSAQVDEPVVGYQTGDGVLELRLGIAQQGFDGPVYLMHGTTQVASGRPDTNGVVLLRAAASTCTTTSPCTVALTPSSTDPDLAGGWALTGGIVSGSSADIALVAGQVTLASGNVGLAGSIRLDLAGAPASSVAPDLDSYAGTGVAGTTGAGGAATSAELDGPAGVAVDGAGNVFVANSTSCEVDEITATTGVLSVVAGDGTCGSSGTGGTAASAELDHPTGLAVTPSGVLYIGTTTTCRVREVTGGTISTVAGNGTCGASTSGSATGTPLGSINALAVTATGTLYVGQSTYCQVDRVSGGTITTIAGTGSCGTSYTSGGAATSQQLADVWGLAVDAAGNLYISDGTANLVTVLPDSTGSLYGVAVAPGNLYTVASNATPGVPAAGAGHLTAVTGVAIGAGGTLFVASQGTDSLDRISPAGVAAVVAGTGTAGSGGSGGLASSAQLGSPYGLVAGPDGSLYVANTSTDLVDHLVYAVDSALAPGSVCLWGTFPDGVSSVSVPFCNTTAATSIVISQYPDPHNAALEVPVPPGATVTLSTDDPAQMCPQEPGMERYTPTGWRAGAVCTSWTWGAPTSLVEIDGRSRVFTGATVTVRYGVTSWYEVVWRSPADAPVTGAGNTSTWSQPRLSQSCSADGSCTPTPPLDYEAMYCTASKPSCLT